VLTCLRSTLGVLRWLRWYWFLFCRLLTLAYGYFHFLCLLSSRFDRSLPCPNLSWLCCCFFYFLCLCFADTCHCLFLWILHRINYLYFLHFVFIYMEFLYLVCYLQFLWLGVCILGVPWVYFSLFAVTFAGSLLLCMYVVVALSELWICRWLRVASGRDPSVGVRCM